MHPRQRASVGVLAISASLSKLFERYHLVYRGRQVQISRWVMCASSWMRPVSTSRWWTTAGSLQRGVCGIEATGGGRAVRAFLGVISTLDDGARDTG